MKRAFLIPILFLAVNAAFAAWVFLAVHPAQAQDAPPDPTAEPTFQGMRPTPATDRLAPWPTVYPPTQADNGAQDYWAHCMMCHGDRGQGLNQDWLSVMNPQDRDCWQFGCHNPHHPPDGFVFPKVVPPVIGKGVLDNFSTGLDVYHFIKLYMPYQNPGHLPDQTYWDLAAYLLRENGYYDGKEPLDAQRAAAIQIHPAAPRPPAGPDWSGWVPYLIAGGVLVLFFAVLGIYRWRERTKRP